MKKLVVIAQLPIISRYRTQSTAVTIADRDFQKSKNTSRTTFRGIAEGVFCVRCVWFLVLILLVITGVYELRHWPFFFGWYFFVIVVVAWSDLRRAVENKQCSCTDRTLIIQWYWRKRLKEKNSFRREKSPVTKRHAFKRLPVASVESLRVFFRLKGVSVAIGTRGW